MKRKSYSNQPGPLWKSNCPLKLCLWLSGYTLTDTKNNGNNILSCFRSYLTHCDKNVLNIVILCSYVFSSVCSWQWAFSDSWLTHRSSLQFFLLLFIHDSQHSCLQICYKDLLCMYPVYMCMRDCQGYIKRNKN